MLMAFWEVQRLTREINELELQAMQTRRRLSNYQKYAGMLGGSESRISAINIAGMSAELLPRATLFAQYANQSSLNSAVQNMQLYKLMGMMPWTGNPATQNMLEMSAFNRFREESMKALKQQEIRVLNEKEKEIELEMNEIEQRIKSKRAMLESAKQLAAKEAQDNAPRFGLG